MKLWRFTSAAALEGRVPPRPLGRARRPAEPDSFLDEGELVG